MGQTHTVEKINKKLTVVVGGWSVISDEGRKNRADKYSILQRILERETKKTDFFQIFRERKLNVCMQSLHSKEDEEEN